MNYKFLGLVAIAVFLAAPVATNAQVTTLYYQGDFMTGTSAYLPTGLAVPTDGSVPTLPSARTIGAFTATLVVDGSIKANDLSLVSFGFGFTGNDGTKFTITDLLSGPVLPFINIDGAPNFCGPEGCIDLTTSKNGRITGASLDINGFNYNGSTDQFDIGRGGDSLFYVWGHNGTCENQVILGPGGGGMYSGGTINPCQVNVSNKSAGGWLVTTMKAPEIDPASAASGLTLLMGGMAMLRSRRKLELPRG